MKYFFIVLGLIFFVGCKPQQKIVEVERYVHDTTTIVDTVHVKDVVTQRDSIYITNTVTETVHDTVNQDVAWRYLTFDSIGNVASLLDYTSTTTHGRMAQKSTQSAQNTVSDKVATHEEKGGHMESKGTSDVSAKKEQVKVGLTNWQKFVMGMGYIFIIVLTLGLMLGGGLLYGRWRKL